MRSTSGLAALAIAVAVYHPLLRAQASPTATQRFQLSAFGAATGTYTGIDGRRFFGLTAGADLGLRAYFHVHPSFEVRGSYPIAGGEIRSRNILGGLKFSHSFGPFTPYADILFGRGQINYGAAGIPNYNETIAYVQTPSNVLSPGIGVDGRISDHFDLKAEVQLQRYSTPVLSSGHAYSAPISLGVNYRFDFNHHPKRLK